MMNNSKLIPVFIKDADVILGYLDQSNIPKQRSAYFQMMAVKPSASPAMPLSSEKAEIAALAYPITFSWIRFRNVRRCEDGGRDSYIADVLRVEPEDVPWLDFLRGFKWFAEEHGELMISFSSQNQAPVSDGHHAL
jgi:hypothetical protein